MGISDTSASPYWSLTKGMYSTLKVTISCWEFIMLYRKPGYSQWRNGSGIWVRRNLKSWFSLFKILKMGGEWEGDNKHSRQKTYKQRTKGLQILSPGMSGGKADTAPHPGQDNYLRSCHFLLFFLLLCVFCGDTTSQTHICILRKYLQRHPYSRLTCNCCSEKEENVFLFLSPFSELCWLSLFLICSG